MCHAALMLLIFITFCVLNSIVGDAWSKGVIKIGVFDPRCAFCGKPIFSFNCHRRSTSRFKFFSRSQKVNDLLEDTKDSVPFEFRLFNKDQF
jgi:hypothetical protein